MSVAKWKGNRRVIGEDFFETPKEAILPILKYIPKDIKIIWEPTYGKGAISNILENCGYKVIKTDLYPKTDDTQKMDFLLEEIDEPYEFILLNPPFCLKTKFLERLIDLKKPFMFICPITILETATRSKIFYENKLSIINLSRRINYIGKKGAKCWFHSVWIISDNLGKIHYEPI
jgi:hypothetical protein